MKRMRAEDGHDELAASERSVHAASPTDFAAATCPISSPVADRVTLAHGAGAGASAELFERVLWPRFANPALAPRHDGALLQMGGARLAFATDSFVVRPLEFPGGDIGSLAVHGTLNDLAMCGARPRALSCALVIEEGLEMALLERLLDSMARAAQRAGVPIATGDTKVVERGKGDGLFVNVSGVGEVPAGRDLCPQRVSPGDVVVVSGSLGRHGAAILCAREDFGFEPPIASDSAALCELVEALLAAVPDAHCLRDPTRGGLAAVLHEIARAAGVEIELEATQLPVETPVRAVCELLGLDPLHLASEGRFAAFVPQAAAESALAALRVHPLGRDAACVGRVRAGAPRLLLRTPLGVRRTVPLPQGELLPRIC